VLCVAAVLVAAMLVSSLRGYEEKPVPVTT
jgi:hypothetical protein